MLASLLRALLTFDDFLAFADMMKRRCEDLERQGARPSVPDHAPPMAASTALQLGVSSAALESHIAASKHEALQMSEAATNLQYEAMRLLGERSVRRAVNQASQWIEDNVCAPFPPPHWYTPTVRRGGRAVTRSGRSPRAQFATANTHVHELLCTGEDDAALELALAQHFLVGVVSGQHADVPEGGGGELALQLETANLLAFAQFALGHAQESVPAAAPGCLLPLMRRNRPFPHTRADAVLAEARALGRGRTCTCQAPAFGQCGHTAREPTLPSCSPRPRLPSRRPRAAPVHAAPGARRVDEAGPRAAGCQPEWGGRRGPGFH